MASSFELYIEQLKKINRENPEAAKKIAYSSLLEAGIIDETGALTPKESILSTKSTEDEPKKLIKKNSI